MIFALSPFTPDLILTVQCCGQSASKAVSIVVPPAMTLQQLRTEHIQTQQPGLVQIFGENGNSFTHFQQRLSQDIVVSQLNPQEVLWIAYYGPKHPGVS